MATKIEAARQLVYSTAWRFQNGEYPVREISMAKLYAARIAVEVADECIQIHGGAGDEEYGVERVWRDMRLNRIVGTDEIMLDVIGRSATGCSHGNPARAGRSRLHAPARRALDPRRRDAGGRLRRAGRGAGALRRPRPGRRQRTLHARPRRPACAARRTARRGLARALFTATPAGAATTVARVDVPSGRVLAAATARPLGLPRR